ncbi:hypothetical protein MTsPCn3_12880 [Erythrobacter sp. MTPC3]
MTWASYSAVLLFAVPIIVSLAIPDTGIVLLSVLLLFIVGPILALLAFGLGLYAAISVRCFECGDRFYSAITPLFPINWPLKNHCDSCGAEVDVF